MMLVYEEGPKAHLKHIRLLSYVNLAAHTADGSAVDESFESQVIIAQRCQAVAIVLGAVMVQ